MSKTKRIKSPFPEYPGYLEIPANLDALQYNDWYNRAEELAEDEDDRRHGIFKIWDARFGFLVEAKMELGDGYEFERTGLHLPDPQIAYWFAHETAFLIDDANDSKNWLGPSADTSDTEKS
jgi:hypothetical protein